MVLTILELGKGPVVGSCAVVSCRTERSRMTYQALCASRVSYLLHLKNKNLTVLQSKNMLHVDIKCRCGPKQLAISTLLATASKV